MREVSEGAQCNEGAGKVGDGEFKWGGCGLRADECQAGRRKRALPVPAQLSVLSPARPAFASCSRTEGAAGAECESWLGGGGADARPTVRRAPRSAAAAALGHVDWVVPILHGCGGVPAGAATSGVAHGLGGLGVTALPFVEGSLALRSKLVLGG